MARAEKGSQRVSGLSGRCPPNSQSWAGQPAKLTGSHCPGINSPSLTISLGPPFHLLPQLCTHSTRPGRLGRAGGEARGRAERTKGRAEHKRDLSRWVWVLTDGGWRSLYPVSTMKVWGRELRSLRAPGPSWLCAPSLSGQGDSWSWRWGKGQ